MGGFVLPKAVTTVCAIAAGLSAGAGADVAQGLASDPVVTTVYPVKHPEGLMVTSGGWTYCEQVRKIAQRTRYTLLCGRYYRDRYLGPGLRSERHLDWGNPRYLSRFAQTIRALHRRVGGRVILIGVSYSGFGVATLASHHPEIRPDRLVVIDSYLDLRARRQRLPDSHETAREIDEETGGSARALRQRSASVDGLARLVRDGTRLDVIWSISDEERRFFNGATCDRHANAETLARLARLLRRPVSAWVTERRHGHDLWDNGAKILRGYDPGRLVVFGPDGRIPTAAVCR